MRNTLIALALAAALPMAVHADTRSYTWVEAGYVNAGDVDTDGFAVRGSYAFGDTGFYALGGIGRLSTDTVIGDVDSTVLELGGGYALDLTEHTDLIAELAWQHAEAEAHGITADSDAYRLSVGTRVGFNANVEGLARVNYVDGGDIDANTTGTLGLLVKLDRSWGINGEIEFDGEGNEAYTLGLRASF
jgi:Ax21 family sulfation-dependent quorum factor